jgi:2-phosphoglycerate kinase
MADQILFDKLIYVDRLTRAGVQEDQARAHAEAIDEALREAVATKADIRDLKVDIREIKTDMGGLTSRLNVLTWAVGINTAMTLGILGKLLK